MFMHSFFNVMSFIKYYYTLQLFIIIMFVTKLIKLTPDNMNFQANYSVEIKAKKAQVIVDLSYQG